MEMESNISDQTFISTTPSRRKKKGLAKRKKLNLLPSSKNSRISMSIPSPTKRKRRKRKSKTKVPDTVLPNPHFNCTIDLSTDDSLNEPLQCKSQTKNVECEEIDVVPSDIDNENLNQREVIDLTTNFKPLDGSENQEPTVIDLSDSEDKSVPDNEIYVIGTYSKNSSPTNSRKRKRSQLDYIPLSSISTCSTSTLNNNTLKNLKSKKSGKGNNFQMEYNKLVKSFAKNSNFAGIDNVYTNSPVTLPSSGLRPIIIDGSNVAFVHSNNHHFSCKRLEICIKYFKEKGHKVTAFVPQFRLQSNKNDNPNLLRKLERQGDVVLTPSKTIDGRSIVPYDDRFIVQTAVLKGGIIVSRDNYNDLLLENPAWAETIKYRVLAFTWVDDVLMFPKDPLGLRGPSLEEFLRF